MQNIDLTAKFTKIIRLSLVGILLTAILIGYAEFKYWHRDETLTLDDAKVVGTMVSVRVLTKGKVKELLFEDGAEVKAGDVIARLEVAITEEEIKQLEETVQLAKDNYAELQAGQMVSVPVQRERVTYPPAPPPSYSAPSGNLAKLEERANRMAELFEMGAVSAVQRDAARRAYESALAESSSGSSGYSGSSEPIIEYYTEYVEEFRPTPPEVLEGAAQAIKQAELSLNVARQEARETDVIAPVSGTIYYGVEVEQELAAGDSVARIGDSRELWIEAVVSEEVFDKITLGKLASYTIDGKELFGTVTEKIKPNITKPAEDSEPVELPDIPTTGNAPAPVIGDNPSAENQPPPAEDATQPTDAQPAAETAPAENPPQAVEAETEVIDGTAPADTQPPAENATQPADAQPPADNATQPADAQPSDAAQTPAENQPQPPKIPDNFAEQQKPNDKFIIKISLPAERDFDCRPNTATVVKIKI